MKNLPRIPRPALAALVLLGLALPARADESPKSPPAPKLTGTYRVENGVRVLRLWGTPKERGYAHGYLLGEAILSGMREELARVLARQPNVYRERLRPLMVTGFRFSKAETEEMSGLLEGIRAKVPVAKRKIKALAREPDLTDMKVLNTFGDWISLGCSSAAIWGKGTADGSAVAIRNFDFPTMKILVAEQHVRIVAPAPGSDERGWVGVCHPGSVGALTVLSADGVFVAIHDVPVAPRWTDFLQQNVPRLLAVKRIAAEVPAKGAVAAAAKLCRSWPTLYGNNFMVATREPGEGVPAAVIEYDSRENQDGGVTLREAGGVEGARPPYVICTNHHRLRSDDDGSRYRALRKGCGVLLAGKERDAAALFRLADRAAVPRAGRPVSGFGTLHQVVAFTGTRVLHVRMVEVGKNIRDAKPARFDVVRALADIRKPVARPKPDSVEAR